MQDTASEGISLPAPAEDSADELGLDDLLGDAVTYEHGAKPPAPETPDFVSPDDALGAARGRDGRAHEVKREREPKVSPLFWAAAVVWNLPGGIGCWLILRKTHPRTARALLITGIVSFVVVAGAITAAILTERAINPSTIYIKG